MSTDGPIEPAAPDEARLLSLCIVAAVGLALAEYLFIPIRFPRLFPELLAATAPGVWHGSAERAVELGLTGRWWGPLLPFGWWAAGTAIFWILLPAMAAGRSGLSPRDLGWGAGALRSKLWIYSALLVPVGVAVAWAARQPAFLDTYPMLRPATVIEWSWSVLLLYWLFYAFQFVGVEFFFRGFLLFPFEERLGRAAIGLSVIPYCMIHFHKPLPEVFGAIVAGVVLGWLALETRSIWGGAMVHIAVALSMDVAAITVGPSSFPDTWWP